MTTTQDGTAARTTRPLEQNFEPGHAPGSSAPAGDARVLLLSDIPVSERRLDVGGIPTVLVEGGAGIPVVLLHGPGESAVNWRWILPDLVRTHRVVAPDLPAHGETAGAENELDEGRVLAWLDDLIDRTCTSPPVLVGHILGGAIGARYAIRHEERLRGLVLVDSLGLAPFRPSMRFMLTMMGFQMRPNERSYTRFMRHCAYDLDALSERMGESWDAFVAYNLEQARAPKAKAAGRMLRTLGLPRIPPEELERISVPTSLIWGRDDRALKLGIAEAASDRYGWPLQVIEESADDPPRDQPKAFLEALRRAMDGA